MMWGVCKSLSLAASLLLIAQGSRATSIDFVWTGTSGAGSVGSSAISVSASQPETLTLDVVLDVDTFGLSLLGISIGFDPDLGDELDVISIETLSWSNPKGPGRFTAVGYVSSQESTPTREGQFISLGGFSFGAGPQNATLTFARIVFTTHPSAASSDGSDIISFFGSSDVALDSTGLFYIQPELGSAEVNVIPEPVSLSLLGIGIGALALAFRRPHRPSRNHVGPGRWAGPVGR